MVACSNLGYAIAVNSAKPFTLTQPNPLCPHPSGVLLNNLFRHPYTKIEYIERDLAVSRITAAEYLDRLGHAGFVRKQKIGKAITT